MNCVQLILVALTLIVMRRNTYLPFKDFGVERGRRSFTGPSLLNQERLVFTITLRGRTFFLSLAASRSPNCALNNCSRLLASSSPRPFAISLLSLEITSAAGRRYGASTVACEFISMMLLLAHLSREPQSNSLFSIYELVQKANALLAFAILSWHSRSEYSF